MDVRISDPLRAEPGNGTWFFHAAGEEPQESEWGLTAYAICVDG